MLIARRLVLIILRLMVAIVRWLMPMSALSEILIRVQILFEFPDLLFLKALPDVFYCSVEREIVFVVVSRKP